MAEIKWIKLNIDMFDNRKIKQIRKLPGGNDMVLFWVMLLSLAGRSNSQGYILFTENIAYTPEMLAVECDFDISTVKMALDIFSKFNMITIKEEAITISGWGEHQNIEGMERAKTLANERVKKHRNKKKQLLQSAQEETCSASCNVTETLHETFRNSEVTHLEDRKIDIEEDIDKEDRLIDKREKLKKIEQAYFNTFHRGISSNYLDCILKVLDKGNYTDLIIYALEVTKQRELEQKKVKGFSYTIAILESWINRGFQTVEDVYKGEAVKEAVGSTYKEFDLGSELL